MHSQRRTMLWLNILGGTAVLGSYAVGLATHPEMRGALWGGIPPAAQPLYTVSMLLAAVGYFPFTVFLFFAADPDRARIAGRFGFGWFNVLYALILVPSAVWMPLAFRMIDQPSLPLWWAIRTVLALVAAGSLGMLAALLRLAPREPRPAHAFAVAGAALFSLHTAVLDALVWPAYFPAAP